MSRLVLGSIISRTPGPPSAWGGITVTLSCFLFSGSITARPTTHVLFFGSPWNFQPLRSVPLKGNTVLPPVRAGPAARARQTTTPHQITTMRGIPSSFVVVLEHRSFTSLGILLPAGAHNG